jgi:hypothetical protein
MGSLELKGLEFIEESKPYFDNYPFMAPTKHGELDGNTILYSGTYGMVSNSIFGKYKDAPEHSARLYNESYVPLSPGLLTRGPHKWDDPQTHDDYIGMASLSFLGGGGAARAIYEYGKKHGWSYVRNSNPSVSDWFNGQFWRLPGVVQHIKICAGESLSAIGSAWWALGVYFSAANESGLILTWHMISVYEQTGKRNFLCDYVVRGWKRKLIEKYPNAMGEVFGIYYSPTHLFARWMQGII